MCPTFTMPVVPDHLKLGGQLYVNSSHEQYDCWTITGFREGPDGLEVEGSHNWSPSKHRWFKEGDYYTSQADWMSQFKDTNPEEERLLQEFADQHLFSDPATGGVILDL